MKVIAPKRVKHSGTQVWKASPETIFPLLCPVRETEWAPNWDPILVISNTGVMEADCVFVERNQPVDAIWAVSLYDPNNFALAMYRTVPGITVSKFSVKLERGNDGDARASVTYEHTALGEAGERVIDEHTADQFHMFMTHITMAINYYLSTGEKLPKSF